MGEARATATIGAPIDVVWQLMVDTAAYGAWNPFIVQVGLPAGRPPQVGDPIVLHVRWSSGGKARATERIAVMDAPDASGRAELAYDYGGPLAALRLVRGRRTQVLTRVDATTTRYDTAERLHGLLAWAAPLAKVQDGFERHAAALKSEAERQAKS